MSLALVSEPDPADLDARLRRVEAALEDLDAAGAAAPADTGHEPDDDDQDVYASLAEWVAGYLAPTFAPPSLHVAGARWCTRWAEHPQAVVRLDALWRSWEHLRRDKHTGMSTWLRECLDVQLPQLLSDRGPFAACNADRHSLPAGLPVAAPTGPGPASAPAAGAP